VEQVVRLSDMEQNVASPTGKLLLGWLGRFSFFAGKRVQVVEDGPVKLVLRLYTQDNSYSLVATDTYLGCTVSKRKPRPGETWTRGADLPDGPFGWSTFVDILGAVVCYELKEVVKPAKPSPDAESAAQVYEEWKRDPSTARPYAEFRAEHLTAKVPSDGNQVVIARRQDLGRRFDPDDVSDVVNRLQAEVGAELMDYVRANGSALVSVTVRKPENSTDAGLVVVEATLTYF
jgi:hypothetical protein